MKIRQLVTIIILMILSVSTKVATVTNIFAAEHTLIKSVDGITVVPEGEVADSRYAFSLKATASTSIEYMDWRTNKEYSGKVLENDKGVSHYSGIYPTDDNLSGKVGCWIKKCGQFKGKSVDIKCTFLWDPITTNGIHQTPYIGFYLGKETNHNICTFFGQRSFEIQYQIYASGDHNTPLNVDMSLTFGDVDGWQWFGFKNNNGTVNDIQCRDDSTVYYRNTGGYHWMYADSHGSNDTPEASVRFELKNTSSFNIVYGPTHDVITYTYLERFMNGTYEELKNSGAALNQRTTDYINSGGMDAQPSSDGVISDGWAYFTAEAYGPYDVPDPVKTVTDSDEQGVTENILSTAEEFTYSISQFIPVSNDYNYSGLKISDVLPAEVSYISAKVYDESDQDVTEKFELSVDKNKVTATVKESVLQAESFYNMTYHLDIKVRLNAATKVTFTNKATTEVAHNNVTVVKTSGIVTSNYLTAPYTVKYMDESGKEIAQAKTVENIPCGTEITEKAIDITGYSVKGDAFRTITINETGNEILFVYSLNSYDYTVKYVEKGTDIEIAGAKTISASFGSEITEKAINIKGYSLSGDSEQSITIKAADNSIIFEYEKNAYPYIVRYVDENNKDLVEKKTGSAQYQAKITEKSVSIEGYDLKGDSEKTIRIDTDNNEIIFVYSVIKLNVRFEADKNGNVKGELNQTISYGSRVESVAEPVPDKGYEFLGWNKSDKDGVILSENPENEVIKQDTVFIAMFGPKKYAYTVKYVDEKGNDLAAESRGEEKTFGTDVTEKAIDITGYDLKDDEEKTITISTETNEIIFVYRKKIYDVLFTTDGNGAITEKDEFKVKWNETVGKVPEDKPNEGYSFTYWTMKSGENEEEITENPAEIHIVENTVFTAHYQVNNYDYTVRYVDEADKELAESITKSAVFGSVVTEKAIDIKGYTLLSDSEQSITIKTENNEIAFVYSKNPEEVEEQTTDQEETIPEDTTTITKTKVPAKPTNNQINASRISPKTGGNTLMFMITAFMTAFTIGVLSLKKIKNYKLED